MISRFCDNYLAALRRQQDAGAFFLRRVIAPTPQTWHTSFFGTFGTIYKVSIMSEHITAVSDGAFESDVINSDSPVLVDFWAEWCNPCKMIAPILEEVASEYNEKVQVMKLNIDENPETPPKFAVRSIPTLILFKNGQVIATHTGSLNKSQLTAFLDSHLED
jgi:thioredoxin 1